MQQTCCCYGCDSADNIINIYGAYYCSLHAKELLTLDTVALGPSITTTKTKRISTQKEFNKACKIGDLASIIKCYRNFDLRTGIFMACYGGNIRTISFIIKSAISTTKNDLTFWNETMCGSCLAGNLVLINYAISQGANDWQQGMIMGCQGRHLNVVSFMIERGAKDFDAALYYAGLGGNETIVKLLIDGGAHYWDHGLYGASYGGHVDLAKFMIDHGAINLSVAITIASSQHHHDLVKMLKERSAVGPSIKRQ